MSVRNMLFIALIYDVVDLILALIILVYAYIPVSVPISCSE